MTLTSVKNRCGVCCFSYISKLCWQIISNGEDWIIGNKTEDNFEPFE